MVKPLILPQNSLTHNLRQKVKDTNSEKRSPNLYSF